MKSGLALATMALPVFLMASALGAGSPVNDVSDSLTATSMQAGQNQIVRLAKLEIYPEHLDSYKAALREEIETSIRIEPGVLALRAVSEKNNPTHITIMEVYASKDAYKAHVESPHFRKYKLGTERMIKLLELVEVDPILLGEKVK